MLLFILLENDVIGNVVILTLLLASLGATATVVFAFRSLKKKGRFKIMLALAIGLAAFIILMFIVMYGIIFLVT